MDLIKVENLRFGYSQDKEILKDISFNIEEGKFVSIIGPNGSGKSTLLKLLNNINSTNQGQIYLKGKEINDYSKKELAREIALVPQYTYVGYEFLVEDIVMMGRYPHKKRFESDNDNDYKIVEEAMKMTNIYDLRERIVTQISGGEMQRVAIAKAIAQNPKTIFLDEPTSNLDINHQIDILNFLKSMNRDKGSTIVLVIHDINLAARYSDQIILMNEGKILKQGLPEEVINKENMKKAYNIDVAIDKNKYTQTLQLTALKVIDEDV